MDLHIFHWRCLKDGRSEWTESDNDSWNGGSPSMVALDSLLRLRDYVAHAVIADSNSLTMSEVANDIRQSLTESQQCSVEDARAVADSISHFRSRRRQSNDARDSISSTSSQASLQGSEYKRDSSSSSIFTTIPSDSSLAAALDPDGQSCRTIFYAGSDTYSVRTCVPTESKICSVDVLAMQGIKRPVFILVRQTDSQGRSDNSAGVLLIIAGPDLDDVQKSMTRALAVLLTLPPFNEAVQLASSPAALLVAMDASLKSLLVVPTTAGSQKGGGLKEPQNGWKPGSAEEIKVLPRGSDSSIDLGRCRETEKNQDRKSSCDSETSVRSYHYTELRRTGRFFGGLIEDLRLRMPCYVDDIRDAFNVQCLMSVVFIFFITCASAVAFGELLEEKTDHWIGVSEMLVAHALCNIVWGLVAGQPLCIQAGVGILLAFEGTLFKFCERYDIDFLSMRVWTGLWVVVFMLLITMWEGACLVRYLTRFTEETSTCLIAFFFFYEAAVFFLHVFADNPLRTLFDYCFNFNGTLDKWVGENDFGVIKLEMNGTEYLLTPLKSDTAELLQQRPGASTPDTALLTLILALVTFGMVYWLTQLRSSKYFGRTIRKVISDLAVPIALVAVVILDQVVFKDTDTEHLDTSNSFGISTTAHRDGWFVWPFGSDGKSLPTWAIFGSMVPAISVCILVFSEVELAEMLLSKPERLLKRPQGFHWDLIVCGLLVFGCSLLGLPWMCTGAVQTLAHVNSLTIMKRSKPGALKKPDHVIEQRVTCVAIGLLHGLAAFIGTTLHLIPVAALFGIFMFLGVAGLSELQLTQRVSLLFVPPKHFPRLSYCIKVPVLRMHLFTLIQLVCVTILCVLKVMPPASFTFPFALAGIAALRQFVLPKLYTKTQLEAIDGEEEDEEVEEVTADETDACQYSTCERF